MTVESAPAHVVDEVPGATGRKAATLGAGGPEGRTARRVRAARRGRESR